MKRLILYTAMCICFAYCTGCANNSSKPDNTNDATSTADSIPPTPPVTGDMAHNSENSLDWTGTYKGKLPCADCEGIETVLTLNTDKTYSLKTAYLGKSDKVSEEKGKFSWSTDGSTITLSSSDNKPSQYFVGENKLIQLDMNGNKVTGALAENYQLVKQTMTATPNTTEPPNAARPTSGATLVETYWKLTELAGEPWESKKGVREIHLILKKQGSRVQGFLGCNTINGAYEIKDGNQIRFTNLATTLMACPDMTVETDLKNILERTDNYTIGGDRLSLNKARMAPMARFEAVYLK